jgi:hypothetical protein
VQGAGEKEGKVVTEVEGAGEEQKVDTGDMEVEGPSDGGVGGGEGGDDMEVEGAANDEYMETMAWDERAWRCFPPAVQNAGNTCCLSVAWHLLAHLWRNELLDSQPLNNAEAEVVRTLVLRIGDSTWAGNPPELFRWGQGVLAPITEIMKTGAGYPSGEMGEVRYFKAGVQDSPMFLMSTFLRDLNLPHTGTVTRVYRCDVCGEVRGGSSEELLNFYVDATTASDDAVGLQQVVNAEYETTREDDGPWDCPACNNRTCRSYTREIVAPPVVEFRVNRHTLVAGSGGKSQEYRRIKELVAPVEESVQVGGVTHNLAAIECQTEDSRVNVGHYYGYVNLVIEGQSMWIMVDDEEILPYRFSELKLDASQCASRLFYRAPVDVEGGGVREAPFSALTWLNCGDGRVRSAALGGRRRDVRRDGKAAGFFLSFGDVGPKSLKPVINTIRMESANLPGTVWQGSNAALKAAVRGKANLPSPPARPKGQKGKQEEPPEPPPTLYAVNFCSSAVKAAKFEAGKNWTTESTKLPWGNLMNSLVSPQPIVLTKCGLSCCAYVYGRAVTLSLLLPQNV